MAVFILSFLLMAIVIAIMSIGVIMGRKPISGSCGGLKVLGDGAACEICGGNPQKCDSNLERDREQARFNSALAYEPGAPGDHSKND